MTEAPSGSVRSDDRGPAGQAGVAGQDTAMTLWTPVRWWGVPLLRLGLFAIRHTGLTLRLLRRLSFIDYARWYLVSELPRVGQPQGKDRRRPHPRTMEGK